VVEVAGKKSSDVGSNKSKNAKREAGDPFRREPTKKEANSQMNSGVQSRPTEPAFKPCSVLDENGDPPKVG